MKKKIGIFLFSGLLVGSILGVNAASASGRYGGWNGVSLNYSWHTGWNINGDYTQATATNRSDSTAFMKRVYARSGTDGSYSEWVRSGAHSISHKDFGPYGTNRYEARFYWDVD